MTKPIALITGASSGIGAATAVKLAATHRLILCARREQKLLDLRKELISETDVMILTFDVSNREEVNAAFDSLPKEWKEIRVLVNNAGNAHGLDFIQEGNYKDWEAMLDINVKGLLYVSELVMPWMTQNKTGHIVNIGSIAGEEVYPKGNVYCASKFAVDALTKGMRIDLNPFGIRVTEVKPGLVATEFSEVRFKGDKEKSNQVYKGFQPLVAADVADAICYAIGAPPHVTIASLSIYPTAQATALTVNKAPVEG